jgi:hypothetical protein
MTRVARLRPLVTIVAATLVAIFLAASMGYAQRLWIGRGGFPRMTPRWMTPADYDGSWMYCRGFYTSVRWEAMGMGWWTDYPGADNNFSVRLAELTHVDVKKGPDRQPMYAVVRLTDPLLFQCPILFMEDIGTARFTDEEVQSLRAYFLKGGFLWVDDFWGTRAWDAWVREIGRVLPPNEYPIVDIPADHPIRHTLYDVKEIPQVPSIQFWYQSGGHTSERGADSPQANFRGIQDDHGRLMVVMTHNTDIADTWEREGENPEYFVEFSPAGYAIGVNIVLYAMTH